MPTVAVVCGSRSDLPTLKGCFDVLDSYGITWEASVISAHRQADALHAYVSEAEQAGVRLFEELEPALVPDDRRTGAVVARRDDALVVAVRQRVVLDVHGVALLGRIG